MRKCIWTILTALLLSFYLAPLYDSQKVLSAPLIANYFLGPLPSDTQSWDYFAKSQLLIFTPDQIALHESQIDALKRKNPSVIILAYVPSQSYNTMYWSNDAVFRNMRVQDQWWLKDSSGQIRTPWPGLALTNMSAEWSQYLVGFVQQYVQPIKNVDGIFFDMVSDGIINTDMNTVDLDGDGVPDGSANAVRTWVGRMQYLLQTARSQLSVPIIVINGSSNTQLQKDVNGRMFESFPTPWESGGSWSAIMTALERNKVNNVKPPIYVINSNSADTGNQRDYQKMRFGLASSLMSDNVYFGYDYGETSHSQAWWYDEYDANLGTATGPAVSQSNRPAFQSDVWRRDFTNGVALVNPTGAGQTVDLGGEYEKIIGKQDTAVNDGSIVSQVYIPARDGIVMYKTFKTVQNTLFPNGAFLRFYHMDGSRARNGFFAFEKGEQGGVKIYNGDLDGDGQTDRIVVDGARVQFLNANGAAWYDGYPFGDTYSGDITLAVGKLSGTADAQILLSASDGGRVFLMNYLGQVLRDDIYPFGKKYKGGLAVGIGAVDGGAPRAIVAPFPGIAGQVLEFDSSFVKPLKQFYPYGKTWKGGIKLTTGDFNGDGRDEIATLQGTGKNVAVQFFDGNGKKLKSFPLKGFFGQQRFTLGATDVNGEGRDELVVMSGN